MILKEIVRCLSLVIDIDTDMDSRLKIHSRFACVLFREALLPTPVQNTYTSKGVNSVSIHYLTLSKQLSSFRFKNYRNSDI